MYWFKMKSMMKAMKAKAMKATRKVLRDALSPPQKLETIAKALEVNSVLTSLDLTFNQLDAEAGKALASALAGNAVLTVLNLSSNKLASETEQLVQEINLNFELNTPIIFPRPQPISKIFELTSNFLDLSKKLIKLKI